MSCRFVCRICNKGFMYSSHLNRHNKLHVRERQILGKTKPSDADQTQSTDAIAAPHTLTIEYTTASRLLNDGLVNCLASSKCAENGSVVDTSALYPVCLDATDPARSVCTDTVQSMFKIFVSQGFITSAPQGN